MTREQYEVKRNELIDSAQKFLDENDVEGSKGIQTEIIELDNKYEKIGLQQANINALMSNHQTASPIPNIAGAGVEGTEGIVIDQIKDPRITPQTFEDKYASNEYRRF